MSTPTVKPKAMIQDNTRCIGCRACMVACKSWNDRPEDKTDFFAGAGYQNPRDLDANNYTLITFNEIVNGPQPDWVFGRQLCMHCEKPACASACPTTAMFKTDLGPVVFDESRCIGCRACMQACPFIIPKYDYESFAPKIHKCTFCADRLEAELKPACATVCPTGAISFGDRDDMVTEAKRRIAASPTSYIPEIYGLEEVGGTSVLHLSSVPFDQSATLPACRRRRCRTSTHRWLRMTAPVFTVVVRGVRRAQLDRAPAHAPPTERRRAHMNWRIRLTWWDKTLLLIMAVAAVIAFVRFGHPRHRHCCHINNAEVGTAVGYGIMTMIAVGGVGFTITALAEIFRCPPLPPLLRCWRCSWRSSVTRGAITMLMVGSAGRGWSGWCSSPGR